MSRKQQLLDMLLDNPSDSFLLFALAMEYKGLEEYHDAIVIFNKLRKSDPYYVGLYYHLGKTYEEIEDFDMALHIYDEGITIAEYLHDLHAKSELMNAKMNMMY